MSNNPKVSIIIPVYNGANYLKEAIDSALLQTYDNIEILVINDGSNDGGKTRSIALSYKDKIRYIEKENGGVSTALNIGIKNMTGKYFSWLSHDDLYKPDKVLKQVEEINKYDDRTILYSNYSLINENSDFIDNVILNHEEYEKKPLNSIINMDINGITLFIPKKAFDECGLFDENLRCVQDYDLWVKMMNTYKFVHMKDILASSRVHSKQVSNISPKVITEGNEFYKNLISNISRKTKIDYEGSEYLFLDNLERKLRYASNYQSAAVYIEKEKNKLIGYTDKSNYMLYWLINAKDKSVKEVKELTKDLNCQKVKIGIYGKNIKGYDYLSDNDVINNSKYKYIYLGNSKLEFENIIRLLNVSNASIIGDYLLDEDNMVYLDKYSRFLHLDFDSIVIKNNGIKISDIKNKELLYIHAVKKGNLLLNKKVNKNYTINDKDMNNYIKYMLEDRLSDYNVANFCYQISVIHNKISYQTGSKKVIFYEPCQRYNDLKYSRAWNLYNKIIRFIKREK